MIVVEATPTGAVEHLPLRDARRLTLTLCGTDRGPCAIRDDDARRLPGARACPECARAVTAPAQTPDRGARDSDGTRQEADR